MKPLLVICGPTAVGKTKLGVKLAQNFQGEIVSADSRQVYKKMDVGTGKDLPFNVKTKTKKEKLQIKIKKGQVLKPYRFDKIPVWLLDVASPSHQFNVADYFYYARKIIKNIWRRKKLPILVGGSGLYLKAVVEGIETLFIPPNKDLRKKLSSFSVKKLQKKLKKLAPQVFNQLNPSDRSNPHRLIRKIEISSFLQKNKLTPIKKPTPLTQNVLTIGLKAPLKTLYQRIDQRVEKRIKRGLLKEIKNLLDQGYSWKNSVLGTTIGYKEWQEYFENLKSPTKASLLKKEAVQKWKHHEHLYARKQMIWFKKNPQIKWFDISQKGWENKIRKRVEKWLKYDEKS